MTNEQLHKALEKHPILDVLVDYLSLTNTFAKNVESLYEVIHEQNIIYFSNALEYLKENDASLTHSLALAEEQGYTLNQINSEVLATLAYQDDLRDALNNLLNT